MTPIDSLLAAKKAIAASEAAELAKDYREAILLAFEVVRHMQDWARDVQSQVLQQRRDKGLADVTTAMEAQYRADNRA